ncbi:MAG: RNA polymerase-binding protein DksA [Rhodoferax sp.]|nr:RNA polymerase-binding protein DksA [Rhodoferax sp.]
MGLPRAEPLHSRAGDKQAPGGSGGSAGPEPDLQIRSARRPAVKTQAAKAKPTTGTPARAAKAPVSAPPSKAARAVAPPAGSPRTSTTPAPAGKSRVGKPTAVQLAKTPAQAAAKAAAPAKTAAKVAALGKTALAPVKTAAKAAAKTPAQTASKPALPKAAAQPVKGAPAPKAKPTPTAKPAAAKPAASAQALVQPGAKAADKTAVKATAKSPAPAAAPAAAKALPKTQPPVAVKPAAPAVVPAPRAADIDPSLPVRSSRPSARLTQLTVPSMAQAVASTAAKASYAPSMPTTQPITPAASALRKDPKLANHWKTRPVEQLSDAEVIAMPDAEYMNEVQLAFFRLKLVRLKQDILSNAGETTEHLREDTVVVPDPADRATIEEEHALELRTRDRERKLLKKIEQSIQRIDAGDYGYCDETGEAIGVGRLLARPTATLSLEAQQRRELKQRMFGD